MGNKTLRPAVPVG